MTEDPDESSASQGKIDPFASAEAAIPRFNLDPGPDDDDDDDGPAPDEESEGSAGEKPALPRTSGMGAVHLAPPAKATSPEPEPAPAPEPPAPASPPPREEEVLAALGLDPERLREVAAQLEAARARGEQLDPAAALAGVVSPTVLEKLKGGDRKEAEPPPAPRSRKVKRVPSDEQPKPKKTDEPPKRRPGVEKTPSDEQPKVGRGAPRAGRTPDARDEEGAARGARSGAPQADASEVEKTPSDEQPKARPSQRRSARVPEAPAVEAAVAPPKGRPSQRREAAPGEEDRESTPPLGVKLHLPPLEESETRRFDPSALAAASLRPRRSPAQLVPIAAGGVAILAAAGLVVWIARRQPPPPPPVVLPTPATEVEPATEVPGRVTEAEVDPWPDVAAKAEELERTERYAEALALLRGTPRGVIEAHLAEARPTRDRLKALDEFQKAADAVLRAAAILRAAGRHSEAIQAIDELLTANRALEESPTARRVAAAREETLADARTAATSTEPAPPPPSREEPPERAATFERRAAHGRAVAAALGARIRKDQERVGEQRRAEGARVHDATQAAPLDVELAPGYVVKRAVVESMDDRGLTLRPGGTGDAIRWSWIQLDPDVATRIRRLALRDGNADDLVRFGRWCLIQHLFDEARAAFTRAVQVDPKKMDQVPDVSQFARAGRLFGGAIERSGQSLEVTWRFSRAAEGADFEDEPNARGVLRDGRLEVRGRGAFFTAVKEVGFDGRVAVTGQVGPASHEALVAFGVAFAWGTRREVAWFAAASKVTGDVLLLERRAGRAPRVVDRKPGLLKGEAKPEVILEVDDDEVRVKALHRTQLKADVDPPWGESARLLVGGTSPGDGAASVEGLVLNGLVRSAWLRKATGEVDAMLLAALAHTEELPVFAEPPGRPAPVDLSAEDAFGVAGVPPAALEEYGKARVRAASSDPVDLLAAASALDRVIDAAPGFAAALFRRGVVLRRLGRPQPARADLERADAACPRFFEAKAERARLLALAGKVEEAAPLAEAAVTACPDFAPAQAARGIVAFCKGDLPAAGEALDLALALDPWDDELRGLRRNVAHVLAGPPWPRAFHVETEHYVVETDITQRRAEEYGRELEAVRRFFAARFGVEDPPPDPARRAKVLIFDTREGFHAYAELTTDDRVESLLGYYLPRYRQLLLYEDKDDATLDGTRSVLYHEAFHQFVDGRVADMPKWLDEGLAEYYGGCSVESGKVTRSGLVHEARLRDARRFVATGGGPVPFPRLMLESPSEFYSGPVPAKYAEAWSLVHFFEHGAKDEVKERWKRYVTLLRQGAPSKRAFEEAWGGVAWDDLQAAWWAYVKGL